MPGQFSQHPRQNHFGVSSLEATLHRGLHLALRLGGTHALAEEIGIAAEVLGWRQCDRIDPVLDRDLARGWEPRDPMSERFDEVIERRCGQRAINPAVPLSQIGVIVFPLSMTSSALARPMSRARCWKAPPPGSTPSAGSG